VQFTFGDYVLDPKRRELSHCAEVVPVGPQVFDLLMHLVSHRDRVVTKDELLQAVWTGRIDRRSQLHRRVPPGPPFAQLNGAVAARPGLGGRSGPAAPSPRDHPGCVARTPRSGRVTLGALSPVRQAFTHMSVATGSMVAPH